MDVFNAVRTVLAVRAYDDRPIPDDIVRRIVEAGHLTGSSMNKQPWHFIVVRDPANLKKLGAATPSGPYVAGAQLAVVVAVEKASIFAVSDASRAAQSMILTAWADGVASNWAGFGGLEDAKALLNIPADFNVLAVLPFGYPATSIGRGKKQRRPLGEVVSGERFGQPFQ